MYIIFKRWKYMALLSVQFLVLSSVGIICSKLCHMKEDFIFLAYWAATAITKLFQFFVKYDYHCPFFVIILILTRWTLTFQYLAWCYTHKQYRCNTSMMLLKVLDDLHILEQLKCLFFYWRIYLKTTLIKLLTVLL